MISLGDSYITGDGEQSYPLVAGKLLNWAARHFAVDGLKMNAIQDQLAAAGILLSNVTHIVITTSGNDVSVKNSLMELILSSKFLVSPDRIRFF